MDFSAFFKLSYGLYILSSKANDKKNGCIINTAFQVTAEPAQMAIALNKDNYTHQLIASSKKFTISALNQNVNKDIVGTFGYSSGANTDKFQNIEWKEGENGQPVVVQDCCAYFECEVVETLDVGTHTVFVAKVTNWQELDKDAEPLTYAYYRKVFKAKAPKNAPTYIKESKETMEKDASGIYRCQVCGYEYDPAKGDPDNGIPAGTAFEDLPENWVCPLCSAPKDMFEPAE